MPRLLNLILAAATVPLSVFAAEASPPCPAPEFTMPKDYVVLAVSARTPVGEYLNYHIDQSGEVARRVRLTVNYTKKPVFLLVKAEVPVVWEVSWVKGTRIAGVSATSRRQQIFTGLPPAAQVLIRTYSTCGYGGSDADDDAALSRDSSQVFGKGVDDSKIIRSRDVLLGDSLPAGAKLVSVAPKPAEAFRIPDNLLTGRPALKVAAKTGNIRMANSLDMVPWVEHFKGLGKDWWDVGGLVTKYIVQPPAPHLPIVNYVVLKPFKFPEGLYGAHAVAVIVPKGVPYPTGNPGHSTIYNFNDMSCWSGGRMCDNSLVPARPVPK